LKKKESFHYLGKDPQMDAIGIPINPYTKGKKSLWTEFWTDFIHIFIASDILGIFFSILEAIFFIIKWTFFLIGKFILRLNINKPKK